MITALTIAVIVLAIWNMYLQGNISDMRESFMLDVASLKRSISVLGSYRESHSESLRTIRQQITDTNATVDAMANDIVTLQRLDDVDTAYVGKLLAYMSEVKQDMCNLQEQVFDLNSCSVLEPSTTEEPHFVHPNKDNKQGCKPSDFDECQFEMLFGKYCNRDNFDINPILVRDHGNKRRSYSFIVNDNVYDLYEYSDEVYLLGTCKINDQIIMCRKLS